MHKLSFHKSKNLVKVAEIKTVARRICYIFKLIHQGNAFFVHYKLYKKKYRKALTFYDNKTFDATG